MLLTYVRDAVRNIVKARLYAAINILGLAVGLSSFLMISLFLHYELSYDSFFAKAKNIYRLSPDYPATATTPERHPVANGGPLARLIVESAHEDIREVARIAPLQILVVGDELAAQERIYFSDSSFWRIFDFEWIQGSPETIANRPDSMVITVSQAKRYFGDANPYGRTLSLDDRNPMTVRGVISDIPANSHLTNGMFVPIEHLSRQTPFSAETWGFTAFHTYLLLRPGAEATRVASDIAALAAPVFANSSFASAPTFTSTALEDIHLAPARDGELAKHEGPLLLASYAAIAVVLLLIACVNYVNIATARTSWRAREVGIRKTSGAGRRELLGQLLAESFLIVVLALCLALALLEVLLPVFSATLGKPLSMEALSGPGFMAFIAGVTLLTVLGAGCYPALKLSSVHPSRALRAQAGPAEGSLFLRNALVVLQFTLSIALVSATLVIYLQMRFVNDMDLGFNKEQVLVLRGTKEKGLGPNWSALQMELLNHPNVVAATEGTLSPGQALRKVRIEGGSPDGVDMASTLGGFEFLPTFDIPLLAGRYFDYRLRSDVLTSPVGLTPESPRSGSYILSESAVRALGLTPQEIIGRRVEMDFSSNFTNAIPGPVVGVVADIHPASLYVPPQPTAFMVPGPTWGPLPTFDQASVRITGDNVEATVAWIVSRWKLFAPDVPLIYDFLDTRYSTLYQEDEQQARLFTLFATLAVFIACLGLFGLAAFSVEKRFREIGIRKAMGSSVWQVVLLLTTDFSRLVLIANVIAWPLAYVAMKRWLENFAFRIDLTPMIFIGSGAIALCVAWVTVGGIAVKAASAKPVLALRYE